MVTKKTAVKKKVVSKQLVTKKVAKRKFIKKRVVKKKVAKKKRAGVCKVINWDIVDEMSRKQSTGEEIASALNVDYDTLNRACKRELGCGFTDYFKKKAPAGKASLRRRQYELAMDGNATMLVWLGKNWLGQTDKVETDNISSDGSMKPNIIQIVAK